MNLGHFCRANKICFKDSGRIYLYVRFKLTTMWHRYSYFIVIAWLCLWTKGMLTWLCLWQHFVLWIDIDWNDWPSVILVMTHDVRESNHDIQLDCGGFTDLRPWFVHVNLVCLIMDVYFVRGHDMIEIDNYTCVCFGRLALVVR